MEKNNVEKIAEIVEEINGYGEMNHLQIDQYTDVIMAWHKQEMRRVLEDIQFKWYYRGKLKVVDLDAVEEALKDLEKGEE